MQPELRSVLIVSKKPKMTEFIRSAIPKDKFHPVRTVTSAAEARRILVSSEVDIVIIDTPLSDEFGTSLAKDIAPKCAAAVIVKPDFVEKTAYTLEPLGVVTLPSVLYKSVLYQTVMLLSSSISRMKKLRDHSNELRQRLSEVKAITKAKMLLMTERGMTEEQAHRYIEKTAMDSSKKKIEVAKAIIEELSDDDD